jgi:hypothetical protein
VDPARRVMCRLPDVSTRSAEAVAHGRNYALAVQFSAFEPPERTGLSALTSMTPKVAICTPWSTKSSATGWLLELGTVA